MPDDARAAGLVLIGWLARRMPGESAHALGVEEMRAACAAAHATSGDRFRERSEIPFRETPESGFRETSGDRYPETPESGFRETSGNRYPETSGNRYPETSSNRYPEAPTARFRANGREVARRPSNRSR